MAFPVSTTEYVLAKSIMMYKITKIKDNWPQETRILTWWNVQQLDSIVKSLERRKHGVNIQKICFWEKEMESIVQQAKK